MEVISTYEHTGRSIIYHGHEYVSAPATILLCLVIDDSIILLLDQADLKSGANVYCYNIAGELQWIVEPPEVPGHDPNYFVSVCVRKDLCFYAYSKSGIELKIDPVTGKVLSSELIK